MIRMEAVEKVYRTQRIETIALAEISLEVARGEFVSVMGPSGCGKSTLLNLMGLLDRPTRGRVHLDGEEVADRADASLAKMRNRTIGFIFQSFHLIPDLTVLDNVEIPLLYRSTSAAERRRRGAEALDRVGLAARKSHFPSQLSGGQQQRVAIARALVGSPKLLLADEPTGNLDSHSGEDVMSLLTSLCRNDGSTVVMVTHDSGMAARTERTIRLFDGRLVH